MRSLNAYLSFKDNTREAMGFYQSVFGGTLDVSTFGEFPGMTHDEADNDLVIHSRLHTDDGLVLMASDTPSPTPYSAPAGISLAFGGDDEQAIRACWDALSDGGTITMPLAPPPWGGQFGMLVDRFGISWMVTIDESAG